ncbi:MAG: hypothetical protein ABI707_03600 [Ferruginibacter sp.]
MHFSKVSPGQIGRHPFDQNHQLLVNDCGERKLSFRESELLKMV